MLFFKNLKDIINNTPLVLSDSYDAKDISINRVITMLFVINIIIMMWYLLMNPELWVKLKDMIADLLTKIFALLGIQVSVVNIGKRAIDKYTEIKNAQQNNTQSPPVNKGDEK
jgi:hypothetical protein